MLSDYTGKQSEAEKDITIRLSEVDSILMGAQPGIENYPALILFTAHLIPELMQLAKQKSTQYIKHTYGRININRCRKKS